MKKANSAKDAKAIIKDQAKKTEKLDGEDVVYISAAQYSRLFPTKGAEYSRCLDKGFYVPPKAYCSRAYLRAVLQKSQPCPLAVTIKRKHLPKYKEASMKLLLKSCAGDAKLDEIESYLPKKHDKKGPPVKLHRGWLVDIISSYCPESYQKFLVEVEKKQ